MCDACIGRVSNSRRDPGIAALLSLIVPGVGQIYNGSTYRISSVRLRVQTLDGSNNVVRDGLAWIYVTVPARSSAQFSLRRPTGENFRLSIESFVLIAREGDQTP